MGVFFTGLIAAIGFSVPFLLVRLFTSLGVGFAAYIGVGAFITAFRTFASTSLGSLSSELLSLVLYINLDVYISIVLSAYLFKWTTLVSAKLLLK